MPLIASSYQPHPFVPGGALQTILPSQCSFLPIPRYTRERIKTPDADFLDLDWLCSGQQKLLICTHGMEGSSSSTYLRSALPYFAAQGWDVLAWNMRGCSGQPNRMPYWYHSGKSEDLGLVVTHARSRYEQMMLLGISVGGNITLKYLGEQGADASRYISAAACFSVPCDLAGSANEMAKFKNGLYMWHFMRLLTAKVHAKSQTFPELAMRLSGRTLRTFYDFDSLFTAPLNGFNSAEHYWKSASSLPLLSRICVPTLLVNAANDSFLSASCYPTTAASSSSFLSLEVPRSGGHVGFPQRGWRPPWLATRALEFFSEISGSALSQAPLTSSHAQ
jgi:predicted alpha/beta-fold hydrolase